MRRETLRPALYAVFATWLGLTVAGQKLYRKDGVPSRWDKLHLIVPDWRFFAPDPGVHDHHLLMRDHLPDGSCTGWRQINHVEERRWSHALWHANRRAEKSVFDLTAELLRFIAKHRTADRPLGHVDPVVQLSVPYLTLLAHVTAQEHAAGAAGTQFLIAISGGYEEDEEPAMVFLSAVHPIAVPERALTEASS